MEKISRYTLVYFAIITAAITIPKLYRMAFDKPVNIPFVLYSCIHHDFSIFRSDQGSYEDPHGKKYIRDEYESGLPFMYMRQLMISGTMPDTINGRALDMHEINFARSYFRFKPEDMRKPAPSLFPMFESQSGRANLEMPEDFFRITWRVDFINASDNKIEEEKSRMFSAAMYQKGFEFPAKQIAGIPTTRKSCDEGYLIIDSKDQLFHLKMVFGKPYVKKVDLPSELKFKYIACVDFKDQRYYAYLFSEDNALYTLSQDDYTLIKWPVPCFNPETCCLKIYGDLLNYNVVVEDNDHMEVYALDKDYHLEDKYKESWIQREELPAGKIASLIFPATIGLTSPLSRYIDFYFSFSATWYWLLVALIFVGIQVLIIKKRKYSLSEQWPDLIIVMIAGIFGFIAVNIFINKTGTKKS